MTASTAQIATELHQLTTARQEAETEYRRQLGVLDRQAQSLLGSIGAADLEDPDLRAAVAKLPGGGTARVLLLEAWSRRVRNGEFDLTYRHVPVPVRTHDDESGRERYELQTPMIPTLHSPPPMRKGPGPCAPARPDGRRAVGVGRGAAVRGHEDGRTQPRRVRPQREDHRPCRRRGVGAPRTGSARDPAALRLLLRLNAVVPPHRRVRRGTTPS